MATEKIITSNDSAEKMKQIATDFCDDKEACRAEMKDQILYILLRWGYEEVADVFVDTDM